MPLNADLPAPGEDRVRRQLGAIIADDHPWLAALGDQIGELAHDPTPRYRRIGHRTQALAGHIVDDVEHSEPASRRHLIVHEVQAPSLVG